MPLIEDPNPPAMKQQYYWACSPIVPGRHQTEEGQDCADRFGRRKQRVNIQGLPKGWPFFIKKDEEQSCDGVYNM